ncbi:uncharacterized protein F5891DRAFT_945165 [Suillus fuscotomentosus]|uniref:Homeobox domain-containing protein n=1 Tax=Suillus fuscotomentosus TaxID=1912939 RepID=A0AAD4EED6_9AGAM|nr:uncharacterized protein F5891DRAFT_945165 [Suillus fuscotomentosus]KAG1904705.1 hypothetical protein F5891DRAFT_945165 [Suillus fuscotomentosus]
MPPLQRSASSSTISTVTHSNTSIADTSISEANPPVSTHVPYIRRRNTPQQLKALQQLLELSHHPTREQRLALAMEFGMELKSVTNWFQNKRQTEKRKSLIWNENNPPKIHAPQSRHLKQHRPNKSISSFSVSLDKIAQLSERPSPSLLLSTNQAPPTPLTPRTTNVRAQSSSSPSELWKHIPSSPIVPQSSPGAEEARLAGLPSRSKTWRSLEWACLKARRDKRVDDGEEEDDLPYLPSLSHGGGSDDGSYEALTPDSSVRCIDLSPQSSSPSHFSGEENNKGLFSDLKKSPQSEDVEAALTLLGFMARR